MFVRIDTLPIKSGLVSLVPRFHDLPYCVFLDSATHNDRMGRYSYLTADPFIVVQSRGDRVSVTRGGFTENLSGNPWDVLGELLSEYSEGAPQNGIPFTGGAIGYWSYDLGRMVERMPAVAQVDYDYAEMTVGFYDWVLVQDHQDQTLALATSTNNPFYSRRQRHEWIMGRIDESSACSKTMTHSTTTIGSIKSNFSANGYISAVRNVKEYLAAGDIYQANISQRFNLPFEGNSWDLYLRLRISNPAPFSAYLAMPGLRVLSASPELFLSLDGNQVETRPIKGTRPRGGDPLEDERLAGELVASAKDRAENIMIVDLMRNDLGKVCEVGSIDVSGLTRLEKHPTVWHLVSTINGSLEGHYGPVDLLRSCFPGGSITGAPKIRAMEIIEEIEPVRRGIYCGSIGYIAFNGNMRTSIAIRTMTLENNEISFHSGGGIVADSNPWSEYLETIDKAKGLMKALGNDSDSISQWPSLSGE